MELKKAIEILDGCIPHPSNKMVDREHFDIALAWNVIKEELSAKLKPNIGELFVSKETQSSGDKMKPVIKKLVDLVESNPELPVITMVDSGVVTDDSYGQYGASINYVSLEEFALYDDCIFDDKDDFHERYYGNNEDELCKKFNYDPRINRFTVTKYQYTEEELAQNNENEAKLNEYLEKLSEKIFKKAIILYVGPLNANDI